MMKSWVQSLGLLFLRVSMGGLMLGGHGLIKLQNFKKLAGSFPDPLGVGSFPSLILAIFAEFFCSVLLILGIGTRLATIPLIVTMLVAITVIHAKDPWQAKELAALYLSGYLTLLICGGGGFALDSVLWRWTKKKKSKSKE